jgi:hypothetical protein
MRKKFLDIEERIDRVTNSKRSSIDIDQALNGKVSTRESRMEVVAWLVICKYKCKLEGGFVRDWIVGHYQHHPNTPVQQWVNVGTNSLPCLDKKIVPSDLDCHLPINQHFDIDRFQDDLHRYGISYKLFPDTWRYVFLLDADRPTGPFTIDLIEGHIALTHDRIDFDVNNLYVEKDYTHELGMRIDIQRAPYSITLDKIVENIRQKRFQVLRPRDKKVNERVEKMKIDRGWTKIDEELSINPDPHFKCHYVLIPLPKTALFYQEIQTKMASIGSVNITSIEEIKNPSLEEMYEGMRKLIKKQCPQENPNEQLLFHGTKEAGKQGILENGFDDRFYNSSGLYGEWLGESVCVCNSEMQLNPFRSWSVLCR